MIHPGNQQLNLTKTMSCLTLLRASTLVFSPCFTALMHRPRPSHVHHHLRVESATSLTETGICDFQTNFKNVFGPCRLKKTLIKFKLNRTANCKFVLNYGPCYTLRYTSRIVCSCRGKQPKICCALIINLTFSSHFCHMTQMVIHLQQTTLFPLR